MLKYNTEAERKEAVLQAKRKWRTKNKDRIKNYNQQYYSRNREELLNERTAKGFEVPNNPTKEDLVRNWPKIQRDLESYLRPR